MQTCSDRLGSAGLGGAALESPEVKAADLSLQEGLWSVLTGEQIPLALVPGNFVIFAGTLKDLSYILDTNSLSYTPSRYYNGVER